mmetsp:Transcript_14178/g.33475  ORF Transcript_14178/g.33475 Transcript_14178/m.33475 type:complete len:211 (-) Transcript_14178:130-762(-)
MRSGSVGAAGVLHVLQYAMRIGNHCRGHCGPNHEDRGGHDFIEDDHSQDYGCCRNHHGQGDHSCCHDRCGSHYCQGDHISCQHCCQDDSTRHHGELIHNCPCYGCSGCAKHRGIHHNFATHHLHHHHSAHHYHCGIHHYKHADHHHNSHHYYHADHDHCSNHYNNANHYHHGHHNHHAHHYHHANHYHHNHSIQLPSGSGDPNELQPQNL